MLNNDTWTNITLAFIATISVMGVALAAGSYTYGTGDLVIVGCLVSAIGVITIKITVMSVKLKRTYNIEV